MKAPPPRVFLYVVEYDYGFAPNPFHGVCTLATCKPSIRKTAKAGDYVAGIGPAPRNNYLVYGMVVDEAVTFDEYWHDARFQAKKPVMNASRMMAYGDNIYHRPKPDEGYVQSHSHHSHANGATNPSNVKRDTGRTDLVLIGKRFSYFANKGPALPTLEKDLPQPLRDMMYNFSESDRQTLIAYLNQVLGRGYASEPTDWEQKARPRGNRRNPATNDQQLPLTTIADHSSLRPAGKRPQARPKGKLP